MSDWIRVEQAGQEVWQVEAWRSYPWLFHGFSTAGTGNMLEKPSRSHFAQAFELPEPWITVRQVHGNEVLWVGEDWPQGASIEADGLATRIRGRVLATFYADCVPLFFVDPVTRTIAVSHAGWRGTSRKIGCQTIALMVRHGSRIGDIQAAIGPSIGPCCYAVSSELRDYFPAEVFEERSGQLYLNLWEANRTQLAAIGVCQIYTSGSCTMCGPGFFSYRRDRTTHRMAAVMAIKS
ncbi:MAG: peptidoglycan editing factor PgeF [Firmicutes bacterium]|nr:peptidoglycan editing factor PgeF [Bacillota bacterium]